MAGEALSKTASATSLTISFHKKCDKEWRKLRDKLEAQFQEDIGRLYTKSLYWDLEVIVNCKTIRAHHGFLKVRAPKFFSHLSAIQEPSSPSSRYSSAALEKASVDYLESFIRDVYVKNSIEEEEKSLLRYLENILLNPNLPGEFDGSRIDSILSPESDVYVTPKTSPSEIIEQFGLIGRNSNKPLSNESIDQLIHSTEYILPLETEAKDCKEGATSDCSGEEDFLFSSPIRRKRPISDRDTHASYYSIVPVDDVCREERPRHLDLKGKGFTPAFSSNPGGEALERELAEQDELLKSFQSILSKEGGKPERGRGGSGGRYNTAFRGSNRLGIPVRDRSRSNDSFVRNLRQSKETPVKGAGSNPTSKNRDIGVSRLPVRKQPKALNLASSRGNERVSASSSASNHSASVSDQEGSLSFSLNHSYPKDLKRSVPLAHNSIASKPGPLENNQYGTDAEMDGLIDYHEDIDRSVPFKASPYSCEEAEEDDEEFLCSACSPCSPDMEGGISSSQQDSGLDTGTSGSGGNPPPGGGMTAGDPTPSDATTSSSWHCLHSVSSPLLPRDPSVPQLLSPSYVSVTSEGNAEAMGMLPGAECCSNAIGEDDTEAAVLSKLKSSSVSVSSGAVSDTEDVGMMEYDETEVRCENVPSSKDNLVSSEETGKVKGQTLFSNTMTKSIEVYQTVEVGAGYSDVSSSPQVNFAKCESVKVAVGMNGLPDEMFETPPPKDGQNSVIDNQETSESHELMNPVDQPCKIDEGKGDTCSSPSLECPSKEVNGSLACDDGIHTCTEGEVGDLRGTDFHSSQHNVVDSSILEADAHNQGAHGDSKDISDSVCTGSEIHEDASSKVTQHFFIDAATLLDENEVVSHLSDSKMMGVHEISGHSGASKALEPSSQYQKHGDPLSPSKALDVDNKTGECNGEADIPVYREGDDSHGGASSKSRSPCKETSGDDPVSTNASLNEVQLNYEPAIKEISQQEEGLIGSSEDKTHSLSSFRGEEVEVHESGQCCTNEDGQIISEMSVVDHKVLGSIQPEVQVAMVDPLENGKPEGSELECIDIHSSGRSHVKVMGAEIPSSLVKDSIACSGEKMAVNSTTLNEQHSLKMVNHVPDTQVTECELTQKFPSGGVEEMVSIASAEQEIRQKDEVQVEVGKKEKGAVPQRVGELVRGDTFELQPGEERVNWFRQEHERRQGSMLFQGLQRQSSADSISKMESRGHINNFMGVEKVQSHNGQFCASAMPLTQSLPPMLVHNLSMPSIPTPPNTLQRTKHQNQTSPGIPMNSAAVDSLHKLFGDQQRMQGDVDSVSPLQRFSQRFKPSKEEDIQSPDSLNNDGPMETFVRDAVMINRVSAPNTVVSMETGEEEEETGPIVEKQTDEYLEKERRDEINQGLPVCGVLKSDTGECSAVSGNSKNEDSASQSTVESIKWQKRTESTPIVSGGASAADFVQKARPTDSPLMRRRSEAAPILSGGGPPLEEPKKESNPGGSPRCPRRWDGTPPPLSAWVVDMSDCIKGDSSSAGPSSLVSSWSPSTPEARKRHRRRRSEGMPFNIGKSGLRAVEFSEQPVDDVSPSSSNNVNSAEVQEISSDRSAEGPGVENQVAEKKKPLFSMFIDIGDSCKSGGPKSKDPKRPKDSSGMSASWQGGPSHNRGTSGSVENVSKMSAQRSVESEAPKTSDTSKSGSVFMYIDASQPPKTKSEPEREAKVADSSKVEAPLQQAGGQQRSEQKGFFMFIEADPTPPVMRKPFHLRDGHLTSTPPSKRHSWNQEAPNVLDGMASCSTHPNRRHKRTQSLSVVGRSSSGSNVPHLLESASGEDSDHASQSASISSMSVGQVSTSVAGSSLSLVEGGLDSGSSTGEFKARTAGSRDRGTLIGSSPENMVLPHEGSSRCETVEEDREESSSSRPSADVDVTQDVSVGSCNESFSEPLTNEEGGEKKVESQGSSERTYQVSVPQVKHEAVVPASSAPKPRPDTKEAIEEEAKKQFVKLSDLDKSTSTIDVDTTMMESSESFGADDVMSSSSGSRRVRPVEEMSWIESKARQGGASSRGRLLYPIGLNKGTSRSRRGRSESPGKNGSNSGGSPAPLHREGVEEQPLSESASALSSMQSSVDRSALEGSTEETDMSSSLGGSRSAPCSRLGQDLLRMFLDEVNTDVTVEVEGHSVRAHKCILSSRCQYFAAMLSGGWVESAGNVISLQGFSYSAVHFALCHIYSGTSNIPDSISIVELATLADMLGLEGLKEVIMYTLKVKYCHFFHKPCAVCAVGVLECLPLAAAYGLDEIYRKSLKWITKYFIRIWPSKAFAALPRELIDKCYHQHVVHMSVENILDTVMCCDKLLATLPNVRWAEPVFGITSQLLEASVKFIADNLSGVVLSDKFQSLGKELSWNISRLEESVVGAADMLSLEQACLSYINISRLLSTATSPDQETHEAQWSTNFIDFLKRLEGRVEGRLVRGASRVSRCRSWTQLDPQVRRRIQEKACLVGLDHHSSSSGGRRRRVGLEEEDGGSSSGCGGSDETGGGTVGRRGRSRHSSLLRSSEKQRPSSARGSSTSGGSVYCTMPRSSSVRAKGKDGDGRGKLASGANGTASASQSQAAAAAAALLDSKHKTARKEKGVASSVGGVVGAHGKSGRLHQKGQAAAVATEESRGQGTKKEVASSSVVVRARKKVSQLDKEKSASTVVTKGDAKAVSQSTENVASRPKTWPMRVMEGKSSRSSPQLQGPNSSTGGVSSNTGTPEKASSVSSRVKISSSDSSRNSSPALRPKGSVRAAASKANRTFTPTPTRAARKAEVASQPQQTGSPLSGSQGTLTKGGTSSPRRGPISNAKGPSRPTPDSTSSRASNSPVANLRRTGAAAAGGRTAQTTAPITPTPKRTPWSRNKNATPAQVKQGAGGAVASPPRTTSVRSGNEILAKKIIPGSKPRTPLAERSTRPFSPKTSTVNGGGGSTGSPGGHSSSTLASRKKPLSGTYTHSRSGSNVSLDKGKVDIVTPSGVGERSGTFLKDEPTVLKRPENMGAGK
ncbi:uncharacterized protein LOC124159557 [Ischnura elegans]|uniref:uncharacterized protein LOC124159557 n=1 Tax=Ischnura elegans TaxID=197161 RepID=UPI001ED89B2C|nr:uncharacterized protein LOC124159557 [Ischnura elegans]XP_046391395.1 uncharacterized protein LOC124159557 [Ischnura elegans]